VIRGALALLLLATAAPAAAQTFAIVNGIVARGDGGEPMQGGTVVIRNGKIVAAGSGVAVPPGAQVIDATGKWVTPGIVAGFSRLGLADVDLGTSAEEGGGASDTAGSADDTSQTGPFSAAIDVVPAINPLHQTIAVNRADGVTRALVAPGSSKTIFGGQGAVIDTGADMEPVTAARRFQFVELGETGAGIAGGSRASAHLLFRNALREAAELARFPHPIVVKGERSDDVLLTRFDAAALVPVLQGRQYLLVHVERASDISITKSRIRQLSGVGRIAGFEPHCLLQTRDRARNISQAHEHHSAHVHHARIRGVGLDRFIGNGARFPGLVH